MKSKTIFDILSDFQVANPKTNKLVVKSVIHRFLTEYWGGQAPSGRKTTFEEVATFTEFIKILPASRLVGTMEVLKQQFVKKQISKENSKSYKSAYKAFLSWAENNNYFKESKQVGSKQNPNLKASKNLNTFKGHGKTKKQSYTLMAAIYPNDYINNNLANELKTFKKFRIEDQACSKKTVENDLVIIHRTLGWLHRYKNVSLELLSLFSIVHFTKLNIGLNQFKDKKGKVNYENFKMVKAIARQEAIDLANENINLIKEYLDFLDGHPNSKKMYVNAYIAVTKFLFRNEIGTDEYIDDDDLPLVKRLNKLNSNLGKIANITLPSVPHEAKSVPFNEAINVLNSLRLKYESQKNSSSKNLQNFLSLAFMLLIPTDRARTYYELEMTKTFKYGLLKESKYIPEDKLKDNEKSEAQWYIHLMPGDYKTGKIYKEYWGVMPNVDFGDGNKLYNYISTWINKFREYKQQCNHKYFFIGNITHKPLSVQDWSNRIKNIFLKYTGVPVTPKEIRKIFITYVNNKGASNAELKGLSYAMHHSDRIQQSNYNCQTAFEKVAPMMKLNECLLKEALGDTEED